MSNDYLKSPTTQFVERSAAIRNGFEPMNMGINEGVNYHRNRSAAKAQAQGT